MSQLSRESISVVIPFFNEAGNLQPLHAEILLALKNIPMPAEILFVDDGSSDLGPQELEKLILDQPQNPKVKTHMIRLARNYGQTAAMAAGIDASQNSLVVLMDADRQNDPQDIAKLIAKIHEGYEVVSGWRKDRKDVFWRRKLPSLVANWLISRVTGVYLHDYGCSLKVYRSEILKGFKLYGEMHRFLPAYAHQLGARITEIPVNHRERTMGKSKYGLNRTLKVILDLLTVKFLASFGNKPIYLFGFIGIGALTLSLVVLGILLIEKITLGVSLITSPLLLLSALGGTVGFFSLLMGLMTELLVRIYYESQGKPTYLVKRKAP